MSLQAWLANRWMKEHRTSPEEVRDLISVIQRDLQDSAVPGLSADARLSIAYNAALQCAVLALAASGFRSGSERHHELAIESLRYTVALDEATVRRLQAYRKRRSVSDYDRAGSTTDREVDEVRSLALALREQVGEWLAANHPELVA